MQKSLEQFKEFSDLGYFGEDWIGTDSSNLINALGDREAAMVTSGSGVIKQIKEDTATEDEFGLFLCPFADNQYYPTNPSAVSYTHLSVDISVVYRLLPEHLRSWHFSQRLCQILQDRPGCPHFPKWQDLHHWYPAPKALALSYLHPDDTFPPVCS